MRKNGWVTVVEDGAPGHKEFSTEYQNLNEIVTTQWPAQSSDLNLIENLGLKMETELGETRGWIGDMSILECALNAVWNSIPNERLQNPIEGMP